MTALSRVARANRRTRHLVPLKLRLIDRAFEQLGCRSVADLGGVWAVDAGYSLYAADRHDADRVVICDDDFTEPVMRRADRDGRIELVRGNFGSPETVERVGEVDLLLLYDVLLHQVRPDWDEILAMYAPTVRCIALAGPWWRGSDTVRLLDLGHERYLDLVPMRELHEEILAKIDDFNERRGRPWRDCHDIWQWGITDMDLRAKLRGLDFKPVYFEQTGRWRGLDGFDDNGYLFVREEPTERFEA